jgi:5-methylcytosine-specific restriction protein B
MVEYKFELQDAIKKFIVLANKVKKGDSLSTNIVIQTIQKETDDSNFKVKIEDIKSSLGMMGNPTYVPHICFLGPGQSISNGFYPCLLYYKSLDAPDKQLILAYGVSETTKSSKVWNFENLSVKPVTIGDYFKNNGISAKKYSPSQIKYRDSFVYKTYKPDFNYQEIENDTNDLINFYIDTQFQGMTPSTSIVQPVQDNQVSLIDEFNKAVKSSGLIFDDLMLKRFVTALETKPFVILSGLAGSGKTKLAQAFCKWISKDESQICLVPVQSDWINREPLLGYPDALNRGKYIKDDYGVIDLLNEAIKHQDLPYFLILDEMNLSYVERYFADFLSAMESHEEIKLWNRPDKCDDSTPERIGLPENLFIIGTINVDETTYMFSPKVLDRANVIEFHATAESIRSFLSSDKYNDFSQILHAGEKYGAAFIKAANNKNLQGAQSSEIIEDLVGFFDKLKNVNAEFGFRTAYEINRYINLALENGMNSNEAVDTAIFQKLLPKLHGSRKKLMDVLNELRNICLKDDIRSDNNGLKDDLSFDSINFKYPLSAEKIYRMQKAAEDNGFTSFAEA